MFAGLVGFGTFFLALLFIGIIGYWKAEPLEEWLKNAYRKTKLIASNNVRAKN
ncbi:MAG: hypothetical protein HLUCCO03_09465 [Marinobacter sp. HL-58]|nr:MAG: hypothetical protein HLUCCO03_09465 [Marinobacter sp. HL-58]